MEEAIRRLVHPQWWPEAYRVWGDLSLGQMYNELELGQLLTLHCTEPHVASAVGYGVRIQEQSGLWAPQLFKPAVLPSCLTDLLVGKRRDAPVELPCDC